MNPTLANFHDRRFDWALEAKRDFMNRFVRLEVHGKVAPIKKELTISVYGPTQVGKTTVILTLLGIKKEIVGQLSMWLRGNRKLGESSTVTVMRYEHSGDDFFHIQLPNNNTKENLTGERLEKELQTLRLHVEEQSYQSVEPVILKIPKNYFHERDVKINIIDLPGVESAETKEVEHVNKCIEHWLPLSEVCLLVDDATSLTAFSQYTSKELKNWHANVENFRVIPTHALSLENIRTKMRKGEINSVTDLIEEYANTLNRMLKADADLTNIVYPIDVGQSWDVLNNKEPVLFSKMSDIMYGILRKLREDLESIEIEGVSFTRLTKLYREAEEARNHELRGLHEKIENLTENVSNQEFLIKREEGVISKEVGRLDKFIAENRVISNEIKHFLKKYHSSTINKRLQSIEYDEKNRKASVLNSDVLNIQLYLEEELEKDVQFIREKAPLIKMSELYSLQPPHLDTIPSIYKNFDSYILKTTYRSDYYSLIWRVEYWLKVSFRVITDFFTNVLQKVTNRIDSLISQKKSLEAHKRTLVEQLKRDNKSNRDILNGLIEYRGKVYSLWKQDVKHATQLQSFFIKHWLAYKEELEQYVLKGTTEECWLAFQYLQVIKQDGNRIINSLNLQGESGNG